MIKELSNVFIISCLLVGMASAQTNLSNYRWTTIETSGTATDRHENAFAGSENRGDGNMNPIEVFSDNHAWQSLFNGHNLDGWQIKCVANDKNQNFWSVDNGQIVCNSLQSTTHNYVWLQSEQEYDNFELRLKFRVSRQNKGNSGVQIRSRYDAAAEVEAGVAGWLDGPQIDIDPNNPWRNGLIYDETRNTRRWINPSLPDWKISKELHAPKNVRFYYEDEETGWNDMTIIANGFRIQTIVNNVTISDYQGEAVLNDSVHQLLKVGRKGHIALQLHKNDQNLIYFKDIEIRELPAKRQTRVSVEGKRFFINGEPTFKGRTWKGYKIEGLLPNARMVQGFFDDGLEKTHTLNTQR